VNTDGFMNNLAMFYLRMQAKMLLPASTIQTLIEEIQEVHTTGLTHLLSRMHELTKLNVHESDIKRLLDDLSKDNLSTNTDTPNNCSYQSISGDDRMVLEV